ncbi:MAG: dihydrolipoyl dehydrogenase [Lentisphaerae bacterium RIFOXYC12_FULL_60_16]|nr:MAG: dihydrolipoyl dehydrogenase [Lentisphaerae bacterium RIFOXYC12_FULL_60_16]
MQTHVDVAIVGAGSAGLSALRQVRKFTDNYLLIDPGPLGTTCARVGCMPSKALIHIANAYHRRRTFAETGISGAEHLRCNIPAVLRHVRTLRDHFTTGMIEATRELAGERLVEERAVLVGPKRVRVGNRIVDADRIILAPGARPLIPREWQIFSEHILTSSTIFEQDVLPERIAVIGLGAIGLELGQALSRLGIQMTGFNRVREIGGLSDPDITAAASEIVAGEFIMHNGAAAKIKATDNGVEVQAGTATATVDKILVATGVRPNLDELGMETLGVELDEHGMPPVDPHTSQIGDLPVYLAGDANGYAPVLHEALDEGFIAGRHSFGADGASAGYCRRPPLRIVFSDPQCAVVGQSFAALRDTRIVIGHVDFRQQARAMIEGRNAGVLRLYAEASSGRILGVEMVVPEAEHLAHLLAACIQANMTVHNALQLPFYHPTLEEGLRTALRDAVKQLMEGPNPDGFHLCESCPESALQ